MIWLPKRLRKAAVLPINSPIGCPQSLFPFGKGTHMAISSFATAFHTRLLQGAAVGAIATMVVGFNWGGWSLESTPAKRADDSSRSAVVAVLAQFVSTNFNTRRMSPRLSSN